MFIPKLVFTDIDGVWTDGGMYYDQKGNELKRFNTYDGFGVVICKFFKVPVCIITGENTEIVKNRALKLKVDYLFQGVNDKLEVAKKLCFELGITLSETIFVGDDLNDIELLKSVKISAAPYSAPSYIKENVTYVLKSKGGEGVFREFIESVFPIDVYLDSLK